MPSGVFLFSKLHQHDFNETTSRDVGKPLLDVIIPGLNLFPQVNYV
jgi:hypothetical protein